MAENILSLVPAQSPNPTWFAVQFPGEFLDNSAAKLAHGGIHVFADSPEMTMFCLCPLMAQIRTVR